MKKFACVLITVFLSVTLSATSFASTCNHDNYKQSVLPSRQGEDFFNEYWSGCITTYIGTYQYYKTICAGCGYVFVETKGELLHFRYFTSSCAARIT